MSETTVRRSFSRSLLFLLPTTLLISVASCDAPDPSGPGGPDILFKGKPTNDPPIVVSSFDPKDGERGRRFELTVDGDGFQDGATVFLGRNGKPVSSITTHSTTVQGSTLLVGDIEIGLDAEIGDYQVVVSFRRGKGIGTESFKVKTVVDVVLTDGMQAGLSDLVVERDNDKNLIIGNFDRDHAITMNFTDLGDCTPVSTVLPSPAEIIKLVAELTGRSNPSFDFNPATFRMAIFRSSLGELGKHRLTVSREGTFDDANTGDTRIQLGGPHGGPVTVVEGPPDVFTFTGPVVVWAHGVGGGDGRKSNRIIQCPGTGSEPNKVTASVTR